LNIGFNYTLRNLLDGFEPHALYELVAPGRNCRVDFNPATSLLPDIKHLYWPNVAANFRLVDPYPGALRHACAFNLVLERTRSGTAWFAIELMARIACRLLRIAERTCRPPSIPMNPSGSFFRFVPVRFSQQNVKLFI
jgi:hypothetical protein